MFRITVRHRTVSTMLIEIAWSCGNVVDKSIVVVRIDIGLYTVEWRMKRVSEAASAIGVESSCT